MVVFGASFMNKKRFSNTLSLFISLFSLQGFSKENNPPVKMHETPEEVKTPKEQIPEISEKDCGFISEAYRKALASYYSKELPSASEQKQNPLDSRPYEDLLIKLEISDKSYYTQAGLKEDFENLRHPDSWKNLNKSEETRSQKIMARHLDNFRECLDKSISTIKKEYSQLSPSTLDPVAKQLFKELKGSKQSSPSDQELKRNNDIISYFNEKLNFYTGLCQKAHLPPFVADTIPLDAYKAFIATWQQDHFGRPAMEKLKLKTASTNGNPFDEDFLQLNLMPKQNFGNDFEMNQKGEAFFRVSSCVSGECSQSLEKTLANINKDPQKRAAFEKFVSAYKDQSEEVQDAVSNDGSTVTAFKQLKTLSQQNGLDFSYDTKAGRITSDPRLFSEVLPEKLTEFKSEKNPDKRRELAQQLAPSLEALQTLYGEETTDRYLSNYGLENKEKAKERKSQFEELSTRSNKNEEQILEELRRQRKEVFSEVKNEEFQKALENPVLLGEKSSKKKSGFSLFESSPEEIATRSKEISRSIEAISSAITKSRATKEGLFHTNEISSLQNELMRIHNKKQNGESLSDYEIKKEPQLSRDIKLFLDKTIPHLEKTDSQEAKQTMQEWLTVYKKDPQKMIEIARNWPVEKWVSNSSKAKSYNQTEEKLVTLYKHYSQLKGLDEQQSSAYELLQDNKPKTLVMGDQALVPLSPDEKSKSFKVIPAYGSSPQSLESQVSLISKDLDKDLKSLQIEKLKYKGIKIDVNSDRPVEEQIADQSENPLRGMGIGFMDIGYGIKDMTLLQPIKASPTSQNYIDHQFSTNESIQENIQKLRELGLPRHTLLQSELGLPQSMESLATDQKSSQAYRFALDSFYSDQQGNYKSAMGAMASVPLGGAASAGGRFLINYARFARLSAVATNGAEAASGLRAVTAVAQAPLRATAAQAASKITLNQSLSDSVGNIKMLGMFSGATTAASNLNEYAHTGDTNRLTKNWEHVITGALDPSMAIYAGFPALADPLGKGAAQALANRGFSKAASTAAEQGIHHGYWAYLGAEGAAEQIKHLGEFKNHIEESNLNFNTNRKDLGAGFVRDGEGNLTYNPQEAQKQSADAIKSITSMSKELSIAKVNAVIHGIAGIGVPVHSAYMGVKSAKFQPALNSRQALTTIDYKGEIPKDLSPGSLKNNSEVQKSAQEYLSTEIQKKRDEATQKIYEADQKLSSNKISQKKYLMEIEKIKQEFELQAKATRITADLAKGEYVKAEDHPLSKPDTFSKTSTQPAQNIDNSDNANGKTPDKSKEKAPLCCGVSDKVKIDLKKP